MMLPCGCWYVNGWRVGTCPKHPPTLRELEHEAKYSVGTDHVSALNRYLERERELGIR